MLTAHPKVHATRNAHSYHSVYKQNDLLEKKRGEKNVCQHDFEIFLVLIGSVLKKHAETKRNRGFPCTTIKDAAEIPIMSWKPTALA